MRTVLLSLLIALTVFLQIATAGPEPVLTIAGAAEEKKPLAPEDIFRDGFTGQARVEFTVKAVAIGGSPFSMEEAVNRKPVATADGTFAVSRLVVIVSEEVETRSHQLGIEDLRTHFFGKTVRVAGNLKREIVGNRLITYSLTVDGLDQLEFVGKAPEARPASGAGGR